jgi:tRNA dimethylallyltransferase
MPPVVAITGPTAAGKTDLSLALWEALASGAAGWSGAEIVSVDSAMIYRGMDIGTAKPDAGTRTRIPHHLVDILDPSESYSAARFAGDAAVCIDVIRQRNRVPILVGGTLLYFRALFEGLSDLPSASPSLRSELEAQAARLGWPALHERLAKVDPETAARLHPNDAQRIQRALEIFELSGRPASQWYRQPRPPAVAGPILRIAICPPDKAERYRRIEARFEAMLDNGLVEEVQRLRARGDLHPALPALRAVGYRQIWQHLEGAFPLEEAIRRAVIATRQYAKRQLTWLRAEPLWQWRDIADAELAAELLALIARRDCAASSG